MTLFLGLSFRTILSFMSEARLVKLQVVIECMLKPNPRRVWSAFCIIEPQITLATLIVVLTAVSHGLLVIDAGKLHFYGIKCTFKMRHNGPHYNLLHPLMIALYPP